MQSRFGEPSGEGLGGLEQRQVRFNRVPEKGVPEKVPGGFVQRQVRVGSIGFQRRFRRRFVRLWSRLRCFQRLASQMVEKYF